MTNAPQNHDRDKDAVYQDIEVCDKVRVHTYTISEEGTDMSIMGTAHNGIEMLSLLPHNVDDVIGKKGRGRIRHGNSVVADQRDKYGVYGII